MTTVARACLPVRVPPSYFLICAGIVLTPALCALAQVPGGGGPLGPIGPGQQTDLGPSASATGGPFKGQRRQVDTLFSALGLAGYTTANYPTDAPVTAIYLGKNRPKDSPTSAFPAAGAAGGSAAPPNRTSTSGGVSPNRE